LEARVAWTSSLLVAGRLEFLESSPLISLLAPYYNYEHVHDGMCNLLSPLLGLW